MKQKKELLVRRFRYVPGLHDLPLDNDLSEDRQKDCCKNKSVASNHFPFLWQDIFMVKVTY